MNSEIVYEPLCQSQMCLLENPQNRISQAKTLKGEYLISSNNMF